MKRLALLLTLTVFSLNAGWPVKTAEEQENELRTFILNEVHKIENYYNMIIVDAGGCYKTYYPERSQAIKDYLESIGTDMSYEIYLELCAEKRI